MTTFDDREKAFENRFVHGQTLEFRAQARRNRIVARWAAERLGKDGTEREDYEAQVLTVAMRGGNAAVLAKLVDDLARAPVPVPERQVRHHMDLELADALRDLKTE